MSSITVAEQFRVFANSAPILTAKYFFNNLLDLNSLRIDDFIDEIKTGKTPPKSNPKYYESADIKWYKPSDIGGNIYLTNSNEYVSFDAKNDNKITFFKRNTILITCIGDIGRIGILSEDSSSNQQITGITFNEKLLPEYAYLYLVSNRELFTDEGVLKTTLPIINQSKLKNISIKVPDITIQKEIVDYFFEFIREQSPPESTSLNNLYKTQIEQFAKKVFFTKKITKELQINQTHQSTILSKLKQTILQEAIEGKLTAKWRKENQDIEPASALLEKIQAEKEQLVKEKKIKKSKPLAEISAEEIPFDIPDNWEWSRLENCVELIMGQSPSADTYNQVGNGLPFFQGKKEFGYIYPTGNSTWCSEPKRISKCNDILISVRAPVGDVNISDKEYAIGRGLSIIRSLNVSLLDYWYLFYLLRAMQNQWTKKGSFFDAITKDIIENKVIPLPPVEEQKEIVKQIEKIFAVCEELEDQINCSKQNTQTLMQAILNEAFASA